MLTNFDIFVAAQGKMKCLVKEFTDVQLDGDGTLTFTAHQGQSLLSGIELVSSDLPLDPLPDKVSDRQLRFPDDSVVN